MSSWFRDDPQRLNSERNSIGELSQEEAWLEGVEWLYNDGLVVRASIRTRGGLYDLEMSYPKHFPYVPPAVRPVDRKARLSSHQYGDGTLCLEWGPDTWHPTVTGADVLRSAYKLLDTENPSRDGPHEEVPSRHELTKGQALRGTVCRFLVTDNLIQYCSTLESPDLGKMQCSVRLQKESFLIVVNSVCLVQGALWTDTTFPQRLGQFQELGLLLVTELPAEALMKMDEIHELDAITGQEDCGGARLLEEKTWKRVGLTEPPSWVLVTDRHCTPHLFRLDSSGGKVRRIASIDSPGGDSEIRISPDLQSLSEKTIAIIGLGSVGGRVALSLARSGVRKFVLADDDVMLPDNICRHVLDWRNVGEHKVDAIANSLSYIAPDIELDLWPINLTGQESVTWMNKALGKIAGSDLIFDATANPGVFNLLASVAKSESKPVVWAEVYSGGFGGMVGRHRPGLDPDPQTMRAAYLQFCDAQPPPGIHSPDSYTAISSEGSTWIASDADVGIISYHAIQLAIDTVLAREPSRFPHSMYVIGLARSWIFDAPFHTIPIDADPLLDTVEIPARDPEAERGGIQFITELLEAQNAKDSCS